MSVTFLAPDAPSVQVIPFESEPDYVETQSVLPEVCLSNANAALLLQALNEKELWGQWEVHDLPHVKDALEKVIEGPDRLECTRLAVHGPRIIDPGMDASGLRWRAGLVLDLVNQALLGGYRVSWG